MLTHRNLVANICQCTLVDGEHERATAILDRTVP